MVTAKQCDMGKFFTSEKVCMAKEALHKHRLEYFNITKGNGIPSPSGDC